jgi:hypothetical protein
LEILAAKEFDCQASGYLAPRLYIDFLADGSFTAAGEDAGYSVRRPGLYFFKLALAHAKPHVKLLISRKKKKGKERDHLPSRLSKINTRKSPQGRRFDWTGGFGME